MAHLAWHSSWNLIVLGISVIRQLESNCFGLAQESVNAWNAAGTGEHLSLSVFRCHRMASVADRARCRRSLFPVWFFTFVKRGMVFQTFGDEWFDGSKCHSGHVVESVNER